MRRSAAPSLGSRRRAGPHEAAGLESAIVKLSLGGIAEAFADRNFRWYSLGSIVSWLSFFVQAVAVSWTAWDLTHSTAWLAIVALADAVPNIVLMPIGGVLADRGDRLRILLASYALATLQAALLAALAFSGALTIHALAALAAVHGTAHAFSIPAAYGLLPRFIEPRRLSPAIAVAAAYTQLGLFVGPALAGWVILHFGTAVAFASNVFGYGVFFASVAALRAPPGSRQAQSPPKHFLRDAWEGVAAIWTHRGIKIILALLLFGDGLYGAVRQMAPALADSALGGGVGGLSTLLAGGGIGATIAALWLAQGGVARASSTTILWGFLGFVAAVAALTLSRRLGEAALAMAGIGACFEICRTGAAALLQLSVPDALRGRIMSTLFLLTRLANATGVAVVGAAAANWGLQTPLLFGAGLALLAWGGAYWVRGATAVAFTNGRDLAAQGDARS
jgi:MFS family permease